MIRTLVSLLLPLLFFTGCVRREDRNSDCRWPGETGSTQHNREQRGFERHLSADAEFAEELAIRYADRNHGLRSKHFESREVYAQARNRCLGQMFEEIGKTHGVTPREVYHSLGRNRAGIDVAVNLPFVLLYASRRP